MWENKLEKIGLGFGTEWGWSICREPIKLMKWHSNGVGQRVQVHIHVQVQVQVQRWTCLVRYEVFAGWMCQKEDTKCAIKSNEMNPRITNYTDFIWKVNVKHYPWQESFPLMGRTYTNSEIQNSSRRAGAQTVSAAEAQQGVTAAGLGKDFGRVQLLWLLTDEEMWPVFHKNVWKFTSLVIFASRSVPYSRECLALGTEEKRDKNQRLLHFHFGLWRIIKRWN